MKGVTQTKMKEVATTLEALLTNDHNHGRYNTYATCLKEALQCHDLVVVPETVPSPNK